ncbi:MAG TPA: thiamine pyrophosphate-dependent enzyme [Gemmatimonadaceae bacterium]|nr:thiamine pyrophosphate-dependent enzyme [Gemmatimonadaceae bacterium]
MSAPTTTPATRATRMPAKEALAAVHAARGPRDIVITTMTPARDWMLLPQHPLDLVLVPSAMGSAPSMGLGLALAQPDRRIIVCNGDGSMLMNLGSLVSIVNAGATNLVLIVFVNGTYEVTGSQPVPGAGLVDYAALARAAGFESVYSYTSDDAWRRDVRQVFEATGPTFVFLMVEPVHGLPGPKSPGPARERARRFMEALRS